MQFHIPDTVSLNVRLEETSSDLSGLGKLLEEKENIERTLAEKFAKQLGETASKKLYLSKDKYIEAINVENGTVFLDTSDFVVNMVENGVESFDMKPGLLASPKVKTGKNGQKFITVPLSTMKKGKYNWRDQESGQFKKGTSGVKGIEFRIVSENSPADSWIHPGHPGFHFMDQTLDSFDKEIDSVIDAKIDMIMNKF